MKKRIRIFPHEEFILKTCIGNGLIRAGTLIMVLQAVGSDNDMKRTEIDFTEGKVGKKIITFVIPVILAYMVQQLYSSVDLIFISNMIGNEGAAATSASGSFIALSIGFFGGLTAGAGMLFARAFGAGDIFAQKKIGRIILMLSLTVGSGLSVFGFFIVRPVLMIMQTPPEVMDMAVNYASIYFLSIMPMMLYGMASGILRAAGDSRTPLIFQIIAGGVNVLLDYLFITGWENGIAGAAVASVVAQIAAAAGTYIYLKRVEKNLKPDAGRVRTGGVAVPHENGAIIRSIFGLGVPLGIQSMMMTFSNVVVQSYVNVLGITVMSAFAADNKIEAAHWMSASAFGQATLFALSQNMGAGRFERMRPVIRSMIKVGIPITLVISAVTYFGGPYLYSVFTRDPAVIDLGMIILAFDTPFYFIYIIMEILSNSIRAKGYTGMAVAIYLVFIAGLRIVGMIIFSATGTLNIYTVCVVYPVSWTCAMLCSWICWRRIRGRGVED